MVCRRHAVNRRYLPLEIEFGKWRFSQGATEGTNMLILTRKPGESLYIGDDVKITIVEIKGHQIRVGIDAPKELRIYREEIYNLIREENRQAAEAARATDAGLEGLDAWKGTPAFDDDDEGAQRRKGLLGSFSTSSVQSPQVVMKRKKQKKSDE